MRERKGERTVAKPKHFNRLAKQHPEFLAAVEALGEAVKKAGPLEPKVAELIQLAAAAAVHSEGSVHSHVRRARKAGATPDEINHALLLLTSTIGFPAVAAALSWIDDRKG
jgi:AhpD family alkylhydroperoxidase